MEEAILSEPKLSLAGELLRLEAVDVRPCTECGACTEVCPVAFAMDAPPAELMVELKKGAGPELLNHRSPWLCTDCGRCSERCPVAIDVARAMEGLRLLAYRSGRAPAQEPVLRFHELFLDEVAQRGRLQELSLLRRFSRDRRALAPWGRGSPGFVALLLRRRKLPLRSSRPVRWPGPELLREKSGSTGSPHHGGS